MKVLIISDIHDNLVNLKKCLAWAKINLINDVICCGDVTNEETVAFLSQNVRGTVFLVRGNMELYEDECLAQYKNINYLGRYGTCIIDNKKIDVCHEPDFFADVLKIEAHPTYIFYGHTHKPWIESQCGAETVNPGTLGGVFTRATFALWHTETSKVELKLLEDLIL